MWLRVLCALKTCYRMSTPLSDGRSREMVSTETQRSKDRLNASKRDYEAIPGTEVLQMKDSPCSFIILKWPICIVPGLK